MPVNKTNTMDSEITPLYKFLNKCRSKYLKFHTHVSLFNPRGKFAMQHRELKEFWKLYTDTVRNKQPVGIAEKPNYELPILADVDIKVCADTSAKFNFDLIDKLYTHEQVMDVIEIYQEVLREVIKDCDDQKLTCVLLEKDMYMVDQGNQTYYKNGFHLHFPYCFLRKDHQEMYVIPRVKKKMTDGKIFDNLMDDSGNAIDDSTCKNHWLMYGSSKDESMQPYLISKIYDANLNEISMRVAFRKYTLFDEEKKLLPILGDVRNYLPRIMSIVANGRTISDVKKGIPSLKVEIVRKQRRKQEKETKNHYSIKNLEIARQLLPMLSDMRAENYHDWMTIGWALFNISNGSDDGLELWCDFSSRCVEKYDEAECEVVWGKMVRYNISLGTIRYYAKLDNPEMYTRFKQERSKKHIDDCMTAAAHYDVAKILYEEYGDEYVCAGISNKIWYHYNNHVWELDEQGTTLRNKISEVIVTRFTEAGRKLFEQLGSIDSESKGDQNLLNMKIKNMQRIISSLRNSSYKNGVMTEAMEIFYDKNFKHKLDTNPYLIAFKNGVYDLQNGIFRTGRPDDFLSQKMGVDYRVYTENDIEVINCRKYLEQVFPDKALRKYFIDLNCRVFVGGNYEKIAQVWTGEGDNAKSVTQYLFEHMLGSLAIKLDTSVLTGKKLAMGQANAELARAGGGVRWAVLEEPNNDEQINIGPLKHLTGNDKFHARDLFEKGKDTREITPMFKLIFICNKLPRVRYADKAGWGRFRVIPYESVFCRAEDAPDTYEEQLVQKRFPRDPQFKNKIKGIASAFAWLLLEHYNKTKNDPVYEPENVRIATARYQRQNDIYRQFLEEWIIEDEKDMKIHVDLHELYQQFKEWHRDSVTGQVIPPKTDVEEYFTRAWGEPGHGKIWFGRRLRSMRDNKPGGSDQNQQQSSISPLLNN